MKQKSKTLIAGVTRRSFIASSLSAMPAAKLLTNPVFALSNKPEQNWPAFRGPESRGIADGYPTKATWNADNSVGKVSGIVWRTEVPGLSHSSPIIWGDRI